MKGRARNIFVLSGTAVFAALSLIISTRRHGSGGLRFVGYVVYFLSAAFLAGSVQTIVLFFKQDSVKRCVSNVIHKSKLSGRIYDDYAFRAMLTSCASLVVNAFFALTKAAAGFWFSSAWLIALAFYYLFLCVIKALVLFRGQRRVPGETATERLCREWRIYRMCGVLLAFMTLALQGIIILIAERGHAFTYRGTLIFAVALYDFYCLTSSIVYMVKTRKKHTPLVVSLKAISFATSLVAMLTLQTAMFASFSDGFDAEQQKPMNILTGTAVCVILLLWGIFMVRRSNAELNRRSQNDSHIGS